MTEQRRGNTCALPILLAALGLLAVAAFAHLTLSPGLRARAEAAGAAALQAAGLKTAAFQITDRTGEIALPAGASAAERATALAAVQTALKGQIGYPGVIAGLSVSERAATEAPPVALPKTPPKVTAEKPPAETALRPSLPDAGADSKGLTQPAQPRPTPAPPEPRLAAREAGARLEGARACGGAILTARGQRGLNFATGSASLTPQSLRLVDDIANAAVRCGAVTIIVEGHTDQRGRLESNQRLSEARAQAVRAALVERGVAPTDIRAIGYGETRPLSRGQRAVDHARNRRITFTVIDAG